MNETKRRSRKASGLPPLTTRRVDKFTVHEIHLLKAANQHGKFWLRLDDEDIRKRLDGAYALQRLGYLFPTVEGKPDFGGKARAVGWRITEEGRAVFQRISGAIMGVEE